jgi:hypothetical protein
VFTIKYYHVGNWNFLPAGGLSSLNPYDTGTTTKIEYRPQDGVFAGSGKSEYVAALFEGYIHIDGTQNLLCITSDDGSKVYLDGALVIDNDGEHGAVQKCASVTEGVYKIDVEYFEREDHALLVLEFGPSLSNLRVVPPSSWTSSQPSNVPSLAPSSDPSSKPSSKPSLAPSSKPSSVPSLAPSSDPSSKPSSKPSLAPSSKPSSVPS